jgi:membrane peptidoglycan carboxypeptidase
MTDDGTAQDARAHAEHTDDAARRDRWLRRGAVLLGALLLAMFMVGPLIGLASRTVSVDASTLPSLDQRSVVLDAAGGELAVLHDEVDRQLVDLDELPEHVTQAIVAAEDRRFYSHNGYDLRGVARAAIANLRAGEIEQGASTISQQVAQMAFLGRERTSARKVSEVLHAVALERHLSKDEILQRYINEVYFGSGAYGICAAAEQYFRVAAAELSTEQAALLAGLIRAPEGLNPREHPEAATLRRDWVLEAMTELDYLEADEADRLQAQPVAVEPRLRRESDEPYVVEAVKREFARLEHFGEDGESRIAALMSRGLRVHTTLNSDLQAKADAIVAELVTEEGGPTAALVALDPRDGAIRVLHGGSDFTEAQFDLATQGRRQPGSALKPFVAVAALEAGLPPDVNLVGDSPVTFGTGDETTSWEVSNYENQAAGTIDLATAMARSTNTSFAQLGMTVGVDAIVETAARLGVDAESAFGEPSTWGPSMALGGLTHGVTPLELATAYGAFADHGRVGPAHLIERVTTAEGEVLYERDGDAGRAQVIEPAVNDVMVSLLRGVVSSGTGQAAQLPGWEVLGKTGTTQEGADAWFVGATSTLSAAVWVGHPEAQVPMEGMTGGSLPARLWQELAVAAHDGIEPLPLPISDAAALPDGEGVTVPELTGLPLGEALIAAAEAGVIALPPDGAAENPDVIVGAQQPSPGASVGFGDAVVLRLGRGGSSDEPSEPREAPEPEPAEEPEGAEDEEAEDERAEDEEAEDEEAEEGEEASEPDEAPAPDGEPDGDGSGDGDAGSTDDGTDASTDGSGDSEVGTADGAAGESDPPPEDG